MSEAPEVLCDVAEVLSEAAKVLCEATVIVVLFELEIETVVNLTIYFASLYFVVVKLQ